MRSFLQKRVVATRSINFRMLFLPFLPRHLSLLRLLRLGLRRAEAGGEGEMGSLMSCISGQAPSASPPPVAKRRSSVSSRRGGGGGGAKAVAIDEEALAAAAALVLGQRSSFGGGGGGGGGAFERSASVRYAARRQQQQQGPPLPRSSSTRPRSLADPELHPQQLLAKVSIPFSSLASPGSHWRCVRACAAAWNFRRRTLLTSPVLPPISSLGVRELRG